MDYMTLKEAGEKWGVTPRWINYYCSSGRIPGAVKMGTVWLIPKNTEKPIDGRTKKTIYQENFKCFLLVRGKQPFTLSRITMNTLLHS